MTRKTTKRKTAPKSNMKSYAPDDMSNSDLSWGIIKEEIDDEINPDEEINVTSPVKTPVKKQNGEAHCCTECGKTFSYLQNLQQHMRVHGGMKYNCDVCNKEFNYLQNLYQHKRTHSQEKRFKCHLCPKEFNDPANFNRHKKRIHGLVGKKGAVIVIEKYEPLSFEMPYQCHICGMAFVLEKSLHDHVARNTCAVLDIEYKPQINNHHLPELTNSPVKPTKQPKQRKNRKESCSSASGSPQKSPVMEVSSNDQHINDMCIDDISASPTGSEPLYNNPVHVMTVNSPNHHLSPMMSQINHSPVHSPPMQYVSSPVHYGGITETHNSPVQSNMVESTNVSPVQYELTESTSPVQYNVVEPTSPSFGVTETSTSCLTNYSTTFTTTTSDILHSANFFQDMEAEVNRTYSELENVPTSTDQSDSPPPLVKSSSLPPIMSFHKSFQPDEDVNLRRTVSVSSPINQAQVVPSSPISTTPQQLTPVNNYYVANPTEQGFVESNGMAFESKQTNSETQLEIESIISDIEKDLNCMSTFSCMNCGLAFKERHFLTNHLPECLNKPQIPQVQQTLPVLQNDITATTVPVMRHECAMCDAVFHNLETLASHENMHVSLGTIMCKLCNQTFDVLSSLRRHAIQCIRLKVERERATASGKSGNPKARKRARSVKSPENALSKSEINGVAPYPSPQRVIIAKNAKTNRRTPLKKRQVTYSDPNLINSPIHGKLSNVLVHRPWASPIGVTPITSQSSTNISAHLQQALVFTSPADSSTSDDNSPSPSELNNNATKNTKIIETLYALV